jgi:hypothetical protein
MHRFLVLYVGSDGRRYFSEGLIHVDKVVYVRDFYLEEGKLFHDIYGLKCYLRDNENIRSYSIHMIDEMIKQVNGL